MYSPKSNIITVKRRVQCRSTRSLCIDHRDRSQEVSTTMRHVMGVLGSPTGWRRSLFCRRCPLAPSQPESIAPHVRSHTSIRIHSTAHIPKRTITHTRALTRTLSAKHAYAPPFSSATCSQPSPAAMLRRNPTRLELTTKDVTEYEDLVAARQAEEGAQGAQQGERLQQVGAHPVR